MDIRVMRGSATKNLLIIDLVVYNEDHVGCMVLTGRLKVNQYHECNHLTMELVGKCMVDLFMATQNGQAKGQYFCGWICS